MRKKNKKHEISIGVIPLILLIIIIGSTLMNTISFTKIEKNTSSGDIENVNTSDGKTAARGTILNVPIDSRPISRSNFQYLVNSAGYEYVEFSTGLDENKNDLEENMNIIMSSVFPILILPFFMLSLFLVQMIGAEVNDEKTTRGMEIIISNVSPKTHFFSKIIASILETLKIK